MSMSPYGARCRRICTADLEGPIEDRSVRRPDMTDADWLANIAAEVGSGSMMWRWAALLVSVLLVAVATGAFLFQRQIGTRSSSRRSRKMLVGIVPHARA